MWWRRGVVYEVYPRSFQDTDGDGVGDLRGVAGRIPYLARLGVDAIWLTPFYASPMRDFGYDITDHCAVDPSFGTLEDFDALVAAAHAAGLRVVPCSAVPPGSGTKRPARAITTPICPSNPT
jgi:alpha-glucosidase